MANRSKNQRRAASRAARTGGRETDGKKPAAKGSQRVRELRLKPQKSLKKTSEPIEAAQGRLDHGPPVAVIDIGSNSVRLVVYEGLTRSPTPIFNEKVLAGLGREVQSTGLLAPDAVAEALAALRRFRALCDTLQVGQVFGDRHRRLPRRRERAGLHRRRPSAFAGSGSMSCPASARPSLRRSGVVSGFHEPDGIVGDLGGGSLELIDVRGTKIQRGVTLPLGGLALEGRSANVAEAGGEDRRGGACPTCRS